MQSPSLRQPSLASRATARQASRTFRSQASKAERGSATAGGLVGRVSWPAHADLATARESLDFGDIAKILGDLSGRPVERRTIADSELEARLAVRGLSAAIIAITPGMYRAARAGEFAAGDPTLASLIGREPMTLREVLAR